MPRAPLLFVAVLLAACTRSPCQDQLTKHTNGRLKRAGQVCNGLKEGEWFEEFFDGALRWKGAYHNDTLVMHLPTDSSAIHWSFVNADRLRAGRDVGLRIAVGDLHPSTFTVSVTNGTLSPPGDPDMYDFALRPLAPGTLRLMVDWIDPNDPSRKWSGERQLVVEP